MTFTFSIIFLALFAFLSYKKKEFALMLVIAGLPLYVIRFDVFGFPTTLLEGMIGVLFIVWFAGNYKIFLENLKLRFNNPEARTPIPYPFDVEIILVLIISFIAMSVSGFSNSAMGIWKAYFFEPLLLYILIFNIFLLPGKYRDVGNSLTKNLFDIYFKIVFPLSLASFYVSVFAVYQKITGQFIPNELWAASATRRVTSFFGYPNAVGLFLAPIVVLAIAYLFALRNKYRKENCLRESCEKWSLFSLRWFAVLPSKEKAFILFLKFTIVISVLAIYFAKSEGAIIAIMAGLIVMMFFKSPMTSLGSLRASILVLILIFITIVGVYDPVRETFVKKITLNDFSGQVRKAQWQETGIMLRDGNWFLGAGLAAYQKKIKPYHSAGIYLRGDDSNYDELIKASPEYQTKYWQPLEIFLYPHNIFLNFWVELGLMGMLLFLWIIMKIFYKGFQTLWQIEDIEKRLLILGVITSMFVLVVHGIVDVPYFKNDLAVIFWIIVAMLGIITL